MKSRLFSCILFDYTKSAIFSEDTSQKKISYDFKFINISKEYSPHILNIIEIKNDTENYMYINIHKTSNNINHITKSVSDNDHIKMVLFFGVVSAAVIL